MLLKHVDHIANVAGEDHVGIGTGGPLPLVIDAKAREASKKDYERRVAAGIAAPGEGPDVFTVVEQYNSIDKLERLGSDLMKRGWTTARVEKLLGGNLLRLCADVWGGWQALTSSPMQGFEHRRSPFHLQEFCRRRTMR
jgi:membrane dipeptidase